MSFYDDGLRFQCTRCSRCCRHEPGYVFLSERDFDALARHLRMDPEAFFERYCRSVEVAGVRRVSLKELSNYDCVFWAEDRGCTVYKARPLQCRAFPFWPANLGSPEDWRAAGRRCPGVGQGPLHTRRAIDQWLRRRESEPFMTPPPGKPSGGGS